MSLFFPRLVPRALVGGGRKGGREGRMGYIFLLLPRADAGLAGLAGGGGGVVPR